MILICAESTAELEAVARAIDGARWRGARLDDVRFTFIGRQPSSTLANILTTGLPLSHDGLVTRTTAARELSCSTSTVDRLAAGGRLVKVDGRITATSITEYLRGER